MAGQTIAEEQLPLRLCGLSHCFRTEGGAAGRASKGLYRVHQFTKVEMFAFTTPDQSEAVHEQMRSLECELFDALEVPYRVIDTASGDLGGPAFASMTSKPGCLVAVKVANGAKSPAPATAPITKHGV